jgi:antirestriction protein ArdC
MESGDVTKAVAVTLIRRVTGAGDRPSDSWSWTNRLMMGLAGHDDARTYRAWQALGRQVRKGERAFHVLEPCSVKVTADNGDVSYIPRGFKLGARFGAAQTEGDPIPEAHDYTPTDPPPLMSCAVALGVAVDYLPAADRTRFLGRYTPASDRITLVTDDAATFLHELAHAAHQRVLKARGAKLVGGQAPAQEAVAEMSAAVLASLHGLDYSGSCLAYVKRYAEGDLRRALRLMTSVLRDVGDTCELILAANEETPA